MWDHPVSLASVYLGFYCFIVFVSLSIACGLYYLAELCEEYIITARRIIGHAIKVELLIHVLLLYDRLPLLCLGAGIATHLSYLRLLKPFPYIEVTSANGFTSLGLLVVSTVLWVRHFMTTFYTVEYIAAFLLMTTGLVPFAFFLGMSGDNAVLPGYNLPPSGGSGSLQHASSGLQRLSSSVQRTASSTQKKRRGLMLGIFDALRRKRDQVLPNVAKQLDSTHLLKEKI
ncbi:hypothetical protein D9Q98_006642 [Chlorella vulgaris]|uniref:Transmembrane adaptor Erv26 n=1 Tax=Chlorella vulgaris TaxID=3077 RepID=A0A9D4YVA0_CHLVU|nr:hypothetical protein D9Q98_006642 [Chlorella vulgaris]